MESCSVNLVRGNFSNIKIKCSVDSSDKNESVKCHLKQTGSNTFCLTMKRKFSEICDEVHPEREANGNKGLKIVLSAIFIDYLFSIVLKLEDLVKSNHALSIAVKHNHCANIWTLPESRMENTVHVSGKKDVLRL